MAIEIVGTDYMGNACVKVLTHLILYVQISTIFN